MKLEDTHSAYDASDNEAKLAQLLVGVSHKIHLDNKRHGEQQQPTICNS